MIQKTLLKTMKRNFSIFTTPPSHVSLPKLEYDYADLEPVLSKENVELHHKKHHQEYIDKYNNFIDQQTKAIEKGDIITINKLAPKIKFNLGGHVNHAYYWKMLAPPKSKLFNFIFLIRWWR